MQDVRSCIAISELVEIFSARLHRYLAMGYFSSAPKSVPSSFKVLRHSFRRLSLVLYLKVKFSLAMFLFSYR